MRFIMTGGVVVIFVKVGDNFLAGMTGGMLYISPEKDFENYVKYNQLFGKYQKLISRKNNLKY